ncbi:MAG: hypothetical protein J2P35_08195 [Actinobacteria bacterium]|nr:hypothetical protein [Actinomycetota bacterium]
MADRPRRVEVRGFPQPAAGHRGHAGFGAELRELVESAAVLDVAAT